MIYIIILLIAAVVVLLAGLFAWAYQMLKKERKARQDEISETMTWHNRYVRTFEELESEVVLRLTCQHNLIEAECKNKYLQDRLSKELCPTNNHIWDDAGGGVKRCRKCGLEKHKEGAE